MIAFTLRVSNFDGIMFYLDMNVILNLDDHVLQVTRVRNAREAKWPLVSEISMKIEIPETFFFYILAKLRWILFS